MKNLIKLFTYVAMILILSVGCEDIENINYNDESHSVNYDIETTSNNLLDENEIETSTEEFVNVSVNEEECNIWVLDVGQGSSTLVEADGEYMLIDGGDSDKSSYVVSYLKKKKITNLK